MKQSLRFLCLLGIVAMPAAQAQGDFYLKDGDRIIFYGDSITEQRLYTTFVETYVLTRWPALNVSFVHSGWGGDRVGGGRGGPIEVRLQRDVVAYQPTVVTVMLGMNDGNFRPFDPKTFETYASGYRRLVEILKNRLAGFRLTLIQPSPYDDVTRPASFEEGYNAVLVRFGEFVKELARQQNAQVADLNGPVVNALVKAHGEDPALAQRIIPDRVHPGSAGHLLMAAALLKSWNAPATVTRVELDASSRSVTRAQNTEVSAPDWGTRISWTQLDKALPLPLDTNDPALALAIRSSDVVESLNQQLLRFKSLNAPRYALKIDGEEIGTFTSRELEQGINLAVLGTPMQKQAMAVHVLTLKHNDIHFARWRRVQVPLEKEMSQPVKDALDALDRLDSYLILQQRAAAQPKRRTYELIPLQIGGSAP